MKKRMIIMLVCLAILFGAIFGFKLFKEKMIERYIKMESSAVEVVSAMPAQYASWQPQISAVGSLRAVLGVQVTTEAAGMVRNIYFTPGSFVQEGTVLVQLDIDPDTAQLHALEAAADLAQITYNRDKAQYAIRAISKETLDQDEATLKSDNAQVDKQNALIAEKTISAPFTGRLGISKVNPGQYINPGDTITSLETLDPIYVDFYLPQTELSEIQTGQDVTLSSDTYPNEIFTGKITTIDSSVDSNTRNVEVEATINNPKYELVPGMYATVTVNTGTPQRFLTLPQTAITFNSYGNISYILKSTDKKDKEGHSIYIAKETFIITGKTRGDQIAILQGVKEGDEVVTSGQLKLHNNSEVIINNSVVPTNNPAPVVTDE